MIRSRALPKLVSAVQRRHSLAPAGRSDSVHVTASQHRPSPRRSPKRTNLRRARLAWSLLAIAGFAVERIWVSGGKSAATPAPTVATSAPALATAAPAIPQKSVAVLPFVDMSEKKDQEYFSDGMAEEVIDLLAKVPDLRVPARTSSFYFKGKSEDIHTIARRLMVAHILEGSVRTAGKTIRVTAQLIRADNGYHLWSETYDRTLDDVFKVQDEIAAAVVKALKASLLEGSRPRADIPQNLEAHALFLTRPVFPGTRHQGRPCKGHQLPGAGRAAES